MFRWWYFEKMMLMSGGFHYRNSYRCGGDGLKEINNIKQPIATLLNMNANKIIQKYV